MHSLDRINEKLTNLYANKLSDLNKLYSELRSYKFSDYTNPQLLKCHEGYIKSDKKILFVGQETNTWFHEDLEFNEANSFERIKELQNCYYNFVTSQKYNKGKFWDFIYSVNKEINGNIVGYMYSNIFKIGRMGGKGKPSSVLIQAQNNYFNIGKEEIRIINPDIIVFLTGPTYDNDITNSLGKFTIENKILGKCFDQIKFDGLEYKAYRMYHPNYLSYLGSEGHQLYTNKLIELLK